MTATSDYRSNPATLSVCSVLDLKAEAQALQDHETPQGVDSSPMVWRENGVSSQSNQDQLARQPEPPVVQLTSAAPPTASPSPEAPDGAHPVSCSPCRRTAMGRDCQVKGCPFCHKHHVPADVRHPGGAKRYRAAKRNAKRDNKTEFPVPRR